MHELLLLVTIALVSFWRSLQPSIFFMKRYRRGIEKLFLLTVFVCVLYVKLLGSHGVGLWCNSLKQKFSLWQKVCVCAYIGAGGSTVCWQHLSAKRSSLAAEAKPSLHQLWSQKAGHNTSLRHWKSLCQTYSSEKRASHFPGSPRKHHLVRFLCLCNVLYSCLYSLVWSVYRVL